jgi:hypothetical protein
VKYDPPSRDPLDYEETDHFSDAFEDDMRYVTRDMVDTTIVQGVDFPNQGGPGKIRRKHSYDGVYCVLVIALDGPVLVTAWTEMDSWTTAMASGRWSQEQLARIRAFEDREHKRLNWISEDQ